MWQLPDAVVEMAVADDATREEAAREGFTEIAEEYGVTWVDAADRAPARPFPPGYDLLSRPEQEGPHPMIKRNGAEVEARLRQCSLYDPALDLAVRGPDGDIAAYAMFWADTRTGVGLVEPMRVEDAHAGRGVARALLGAGLDRLAARGSKRLKVSHVVDNEPARRLYHAAGFRKCRREQVVLRPPAR
jgi:predicted N-acetyltransferase YhbS